MTYDPLYYQSYYKANRDRIAKKRREKYYSDEEYRRRRIEYAKRYNRLHYKPHPRINPENWEKDIYGIKLYSVGKLCKTIGIKYPTFRKWLFEKIIPYSPFKINLKYYYTDKMIEVMKEVISSYKRQDWYNEILKKWQQDIEIQKLKKLLTKRKKNMI